LPKPHSSCAAHEAQTRVLSEGFPRPPIEGSRFLGGYREKGGRRISYGGKSTAFHITHDTDHQPGRHLLAPIFIEDGTRQENVSQEISGAAKWPQKSVLSR
jgi:hypothetical protein